MKYLKYFENNTFFEEIQAPTEGLDIGIEFSKAEIDSISDGLKGYTNSEVSTVHLWHTVIKFCIPDMEYLIFKRPDEYYIIWQRKDSHRNAVQKFYKCDQIDGLLKCIETIL